MGWDMSVKFVDRKKCKNTECPVGGMQPLENFCRSKQSSDGRVNKCKVCTRKAYKDYANKRREDGTAEKEREEYNGTLSTPSQRKILNRVSRTLSKSFFLNTNCQLAFDFGEVE